ncbi:hypothetical protein AB0I61_12855 [Polymorphospora rubra]|uniref:hypothetical protein n=1 Tax=Polymorphospora rubra TaxID=338584 RepID=UPI0033FD03C2
MSTSVSAGTAAHDPPGLRLPARGSGRRWWQRAVTAGAVVTALVTGSASVAHGSTVTWDEAGLRDKLFAVQLSNHGGDPTSIRHMVVSAAVLDWRAANPDATAEQITALIDQLDAAVTARHDRIATIGSSYGFMVNGADAVLAVPAMSKIATPQVSKVVASTWGAGLDAELIRRHQVSGSYQNYAYQAHLYEEQNRVFIETARAGRTDGALGDAWDARIGAAAGVAVDDDVETLAAKVPGLDLAELESARNNPVEYEARANAQLKNRLDALAAATDDATKKAAAEAAKNPPTAPTDEERAKRELALAEAAAKERKAVIDDLGKGIEALAHLIGFKDKAIGSKVSAVGKAGVTIATAISEYIPKIVGKSVVGALTSLSTMALTGNILGAVMSLTEVFLPGPDPTTLILEEVARVRQDITELRTEMNTRFDRIEKALVAIHEDIVTQLGRMQGDIEEIRRQLTDIQNTLLSLDAKMDAAANSTHLALSQVILQDFGVTGVQNLRYEQRTGRELQYEKYWDALTTFYYYGENNARMSPLTLTQLESGPAAANLRNTLLNYSTHGSLYLLADLARSKGWAPGLPLPRVDTVHQGVPNAGMWLSAARAFNGMAHQSEEFSRTTPDVKNLLAALSGRGTEITGVVRSFSNPQNGKTNELYSNLIKEYRTALDEVSRELAAVRVAAGDNKIDPFGPGDQAPPDRIPTSAVPTVLPCAGTGPRVSIPDGALLNGLPHAYHTAYSMLPEEDRPILTACYDASYLNHEWYETQMETGFTADIDLTIRIRTKDRWPGSAWHDVRTVKYTGPVGKVEFTNNRTGHHSKVEPNQMVYNKWSTMKSQVERSTRLANVSDAQDATWFQVVGLLHGKQKVYYQSVVTALADPTSDLAKAADKLNEKLMLLQAYTEAGFPKALRTNDRLNGLLFGEEHLPGKFLLGTTGSDHLLSTFLGALKQYERCPDGGVPCTPWIDPRPATIPQYGRDCPTGPLPATLAGDPVGNCIATQGYLRTDALAQEYQRQSTYLANGVYVEGLPEIEEGQVHLNVVGRLTGHVTSDKPTRR